MVNGEKKIDKEQELWSDSLVFTLTLWVDTDATCRDGAPCRNHRINPENPEEEIEVRNSYSGSLSVEEESAPLGVT